MGVVGGGEEQNEEGVRNAEKCFMKHAMKWNVLDAQRDNTQLLTSQINLSHAHERMIKCPQTCATRQDSEKSACDEVFCLHTGGVWNGFLLSHVRGETVPCRFCGGEDGDGHLFWDCPDLPPIVLRESHEFSDLIIQAQD